MANFYPRPPRGGRQDAQIFGPFDRAISIHALREEGDYFLGGVLRCLSKFLSTPSARRATQMTLRWNKSVGISIHALREEGDATYKHVRAAATIISIHALREEGDLVKCQYFFQYFLFLSTPSARRATARRKGGLGHGKKFLSTPSARRATKTHIMTSAQKTYFYPRPPRGGRPSCRISLPALMLFLSTPSARRATVCSII